MKHVYFICGLCLMLPQGERVSLERQIQNHEAIVSRIALKQQNQALTDEHLKKCVYVINIGNNDYINNYLMPRSYPSSHQFTVEQYAEDLGKQYTQQLKVHILISAFWWLVICYKYYHTSKLIYMTEFVQIGSEEGCGVWFGYVRVRPC